MRPVLLHLDDAFDRQPALAQAVAERGGASLDCRRLGPALRLWGRPADLRRLRRQVFMQLPAFEGPILAFSGSGDFHHITPVLLARACEAAGGPRVTLVHFDNHPDWVTFGNGSHCGSWVGSAARLPQVARVLTVGVCSRDLVRPERKHADLALVREGRVEVYACGNRNGGRTISVAGQEWPTIEGMGEATFAEFLPSRIETEAVYVSIDKDVLCAEEAATNWDQGRTSLAFLKLMLARITERHRLIGADVVGDWSPAVYGDGVISTLLKRGEALLDQPWMRPPARALAAGAEANLELLRLFESLPR